MTKVEIDGKKYCVETLVYEVERLTKEVKASAERYRIVLDMMWEEIENHCALAKENHCKYCYRCTNMMGVREILETIDKHRL